jgi:ankyrin repeat protein
MLGDDKSLSLLRQKDITIDPISANIGLILVTARGDTEFAKILFDKGAAADFTLQLRHAPLLLAAASGDLEMVRLLLEKGADPNFKNAHDDTPLMAAARIGNVSIIQALLAKKADTAAKDEAGRTALLWAVRSDQVDAVKAILEGSSDVNAADKNGGTALTLAARRDNHQIVELLRKSGAKGDPKVGAGAPASPKAAVEKSLPLLQSGADSWLKTAPRNCISCHHQGMILTTIALAKERGFKVDEQLAKAQIQQLDSVDLDQGQKSAPKNVDERLRQDFDGGLAFRTALFLSGLMDVGMERNANSDVFTQVIAESQWVDGRWHHGIARSPLESSDFAATALAVRVVSALGAKEHEAPNAQRLARAKAWLLATAPKTTDDKSFHLFGLHWAGADAEAVKKAVRQLLTDQRPDGGWAQLPVLASDAYATGQVLVALHLAGGVPISDKAYQRGVKYLLRTQEDDGSWLVPTRARPANRYFESGYPHGKFQFISFAGSCWATRALILAAAPPAKGTDGP